MKGYPDEVMKVEYRSSADGTRQPALFWAPEPEEAGRKAPLLVALHTWSGGYTQAGGEAKYAEWCRKVGWVFLHPHFRGPNSTPEAMGSERMVADILSAVDFAREQSEIDENRIYCVGVSGGGHASLLMAGRAPELWAGVSAWCGISDIALWHAQCRDTRFARYATHIEKALGGAPAVGTEFEKEALRRSPIRWLGAAGGVPLDINHGIRDGREGSVPFTHSLQAWNAVVDEKERFDPQWMERFYESVSPPDGEEFSGEDLLYGSRTPRFRRQCRQTRLTIFDGGHEIVHHAALNWLAAQVKGKPANWEPPVFAVLKVSESDKQSGK